MLPWPTVPKELLHRRVFEPRRRTVELGVEFPHEVFEQQRDVARALTQGRQVHMDDVEAVVEVLAKTAVGDARLEVAVGCGDEAAV